MFAPLDSSASAIATAPYPPFHVKQKVEFNITNRINQAKDSTYTTYLLENIRKQQLFKMSVDNTILKTEGKRHGTQRAETTE